MIYERHWGKYKILDLEGTNVKGGVKIGYANVGRVRMVEVR